MQARVQGELGRVFIAALCGAACLAAPRGAAAQAVSVSGGVMVDARRYASGDSGPQIYDGQAVGGFAGVGVSLTKRFSIDFETTFSGDATNTVTNPISIAGAPPVDFTSTYHTRTQTYSGLFALRLTPSARVRVSVLGGVTYVHHRREIIPPALLPANPSANTTPQPVVIIDNVAAPAVGVDVDVPLSPRFAVVGAMRANWFTIAPDLRAYSIRSLVGVRARL